MRKVNHIFNPSARSAYPISGAVLCAEFARPHGLANAWNMVVLAYGGALQSLFTTEENNR
jgi:hypothetical protein